MKTSEILSRQADFVLSMSCVIHWCLCPQS
jgi:hypothetical protein